MLIWLSFWSTYLIIGYLFCDVDTSHSKIVITTRHLIKMITINIVITLLISLMFEYNQGLFLLPKTLFWYIIHVLISLVVGDFCSYMTHRLLHLPSFYHYHKIHHLYIVPHTFVGVYSHPFEMMLNYISILIGLTLTSSYNDYTLMIESAFVAMGILLSHRAYDYDIFDFGSKLHNIHHKEMNYNYSFGIIFDWAFNTLKID